MENNIGKSQKKGEALQSHQSLIRKSLDCQEQQLMRL